MSNYSFDSSGAAFFEKPLSILQISSPRARTAAFVAPPSPLSLANIPSGPRRARKEHATRWH